MKVPLLQCLAVVFLIALFGCSVWSAWERTYATSGAANSQGFGTETTAELLATLEKHFQGNGFPLEEKYQITSPENWWVIKFRMPRNSESGDQVCRNPTLCIHSLSKLQISYRVWCLENLFGIPAGGEPKDLLSDLQGEIARLASLKLERNVSVTLSREKRASSGECRVW